MTVRKRLRRVFPLFEHLSQASARSLLADVLAGLTVAVVQVPHAMTQGLIAGVAPIHGIYAGLFAPLPYALLASSRHCSVGASTAVSLLVQRALERSALSENDIGSNRTTSTRASPEELMEVVGCVALLAACAQMLMALTHLGGLLALLLSDTVMGALTFGVAVRLLLSQVSLVVGDDVQSYKTINYVEMVAFGVSLGLLVGGRRLQRRAPFELLLVVGGIAIGLLANPEPESYGLLTIGSIPQSIGMPAWPSLRSCARVWPDALSIAALSFVTTLSIGRHCGGQQRVSTLRPANELVALGFANAVAAMTHALPVCASLTRTSVQVSLGATTQVAGVVASLGVVAILLCCGTYLSHLPKAVLGAIIVYSQRELVWQAVDLPHLWRLSKSDCVATAASVISLDVSIGLLVGVALSQLAVVMGDARRLPIEVESQLARGERRVLFRVRAPLHYASAPRLRRVVLDAMIGCDDETTPKRLSSESRAELVVAQSSSFAVVDVRLVDDVDASACRALDELASELEHYQVCLVLANCSETVSAAIGECKALCQRFDKSTMHEDDTKCACLLCRR